MRGYDPDKYGTMISGLKLKPQIGQTQQAKPPTWIPLQSSDANSYNTQPNPVGYGRNDESLSNVVQGIVGSPTPTGYRPDSIAGMLQGGSSNDAIRDMILRKMIYGG